MNILLPISSIFYKLYILQAVSTNTFQKLLRLFVNNFCFSQQFKLYPKSKDIFEFLLLCSIDFDLSEAKTLVCSLNGDANFYGLPVVTTENCKKFQFSTDYGELEFFYGNFLKKVVMRNVAKKELN